MDECVHHWIIEENKGLTSQGVCKKCGQKRDFENVFNVYELMKLGNVAQSQRSGLHWGRSDWVYYMTRPTRR